MTTYVPLTERASALAVREDGWVYMCFLVDGRPVHSCSATPPIVPPCEREERFVANPECGQMLFRNLWDKRSTQEELKRTRGWKKGRK